MDIVSKSCILQTSVDAETVQNIQIQICMFFLLLAHGLTYSSVSQLLDKGQLLFLLAAQHIFRHCSTFFCIQRWNPGEKLLLLPARGER